MDKKVIDFLKSDDFEIMLEPVNTKYHALFKRKINDKYNVVYNSYSSKGYDYNDDFSLVPIFISDKESNIVYVLDETKARCPEIADEDINSVKLDIEEQILKFKDEVAIKVLDALKEIGDSLVDDKTKKNVEHDVDTDIANRQNPHDRNYVIRISNFKKFDNIIAFLDDRENFKEKWIKKTIESNKDGYAEHLSKLAVYDEKIGDLSGNKLPFRNAILDILNDYSYQSFTIFYKLPNGNTESYAYKKEKYFPLFNETKRNVSSTTNPYINSVPLYAIEKITWKRSTLFDANDYPLNLSETDLEDIYVNFKKVCFFKDERYADFNFVKRLLAADPYETLHELRRRKSPFLSDRNFFLDIKDMIRLYNVVDCMDDALKKDVDFLIQLLPKPNEDVYSVDYLYVNLDQNTKKDKKLVQACLDAGLEAIKIARTAPVEISTSDMILSKLDGQKVAYPSIGDYSDLYRCDLDKLEVVFERSFIRENFHRLNWNNISNVKLVEYLKELSGIKVFEDINPALKKTLFNYILELDNDDLIYMTSCAVDSFADIETFFKKLKIDEAKENDKIIPFCSFSPTFIKLLSPENVKTFAESEAHEIVKCEAVDKDQFKVETAYNIFKFNVAGNSFNVTSLATGKDAFLNAHDVKVFIEAITPKIYENIKTLTGKECNTLAKAHKALLEMQAVKPDIEEER